MGNPAEELYRRNAIVGGCKVIYVEINSSVRMIAVRGQQWNEILSKLTCVATEAMLRKDLCKTSEISWTWRTGGCWEVSISVRKGSWDIT